MTRILHTTHCAHCGKPIERVHGVDYHVRTEGKVDVWTATCSARCRAALGLVERYQPTAPIS